MTAHAVPLPDFIIYGKAFQAVTIEAYCNGISIAKTRVENGYYKLRIPMDTKSGCRKGNILDIWIDTQHSGETIPVGDFGTAEKLDLE